MQPFGMSDQDHVEIWRRYRLGETQDTIGAAIGCTGPAVYYVVRQRGGSRRRRASVPSGCCRSPSGSRFRAD